MKAKQQERPLGAGRSLTPDQDKQLQNLISDKTPESAEDGLCVVDAESHERTYHTANPDQAGYQDGK